MRERALKLVNELIELDEQEKFISPSYLISIMLLKKALERALKQQSKSLSKFKEKVN